MAIVLVRTLGKGHVYVRRDPIGEADPDGAVRCGRMRDGIAQRFCRWRRVGALPALLVLGVGACTPDEGSLTPSEVAIVLSLSPLSPPPRDPTNEVSGNCQAIDFGRNLFWDMRLSADGERSCATCHIPEKSWADARSVTITPGVARNVPTLWNMAYSHWYFWDGRADSLWAQAAGPIEGSEELNLDRLTLAHRVYAEPDLKAEYEALFDLVPNLADHAAYPVRGGPSADVEGRAAWHAMSQDNRDAITQVLVNISKTIAAFEETITSRNSAFDEFVQSVRTGDRAGLHALSADARRGLKVFAGRGQCYQCHSGPNLSDGEFHNMLLFPDDGRQLGDRGRHRGLELLDAGELRGDGRFSFSPGNNAKLTFTRRGSFTVSQFKTPSLRNVAERTRFMHDGEISTLRAVTDHYASIQARARFHRQGDPVLTSIELTPQDTSDLLSFLHSLTDTSRLETIWDDCVLASP